MHTPTFFRWLSVDLFEDDPPVRPWQLESKAGLGPARRFQHGCCRELPRCVHASNTEPCLPGTAKGWLSTAWRRALAYANEAMAGWGISLGLDDIASSAVVVPEPGGLGLWALLPKSSADHPLRVHPKAVLKTHAVQTLARSRPDLRIREAFGVRAVDRRFSPARVIKTGAALAQRLR